MSSSFKVTFGLALAVVALAWAGEWLLAAVYGEDEVRCQEASVPDTLPDLPEASSIAASRRNPGRLWVINDSGAPTVTGIDEEGNAMARVQVGGGASVKDWEDISVGKCAAGSCIYVADIGDTVTARLGVAELFPAKRRVRLTTQCRNQRGELVIDGEAMVQVAGEGG